MKRFFLSALMMLGLVAVVSSCKETPDPVPVLSVSVSPATLEMTMGDAPKQLTVSVKPANADNIQVLWTATGDCVTVDEEGMVSAVAEGTATVVATAADGSGMKGECEVTVKAATVDVTGINIPAELTLEEGLDITLTAEVLPENATNKAVVWSVTDAAPEGCVLVSEEGLVSAVMVGTANVVATAADGSEVSATCAVTVEEAVVYVSEITMESELTLTMDDTQTLATTVLPEDATSKELTWSVANAAPEGCVTVDATGLVTAVVVGTADVIATAADGSEVSATCAVTVNPVYVTSITIEPQEVSLAIGATQTLATTVLPAEATINAVIWSVKEGTSDVCTVDENGLVTAVAPGTVTVVAAATDGSGVTGECAVTVEAKAYAVGDAYPNAEEPIGIVFYVEDGGTTGKVISLEFLDNHSWGPVADAGTDLLNGLANMVEVQEIDETFESYPAFNQVHLLNPEDIIYSSDMKNVWYLPSVKELRQLFAGMSGLHWIDGSNGVIDSDAGTITDWSYSMTNYYAYKDNRTEFNDKISAVGGEKISDNSLWSSSQSYNSMAYTADMFMCYSNQENKSYSRGVRAIMQF